MFLLTFQVQSVLAIDCSVKATEEHDDPTRPSPTDDLPLDSSRTLIPRAARFGRKLLQSVACNASSLSPTSDSPGNVLSSGDNVGAASEGNTGLEARLAYETPPP